MTEIVELRGEKRTVFDASHDNEEMARRYKVISGPQFNAGLILIGVGRISIGEKVLDLGCGTGELTAFIAILVGEKEGRVCGVDVSEERIRDARRLEKDHANISFSQGSAENIPHPDGSFDVVFFNATIHWVDNQLKALQECLRVLRPGGRLVLTTASAEDISPPDQIKAEVLAEDFYRPYYQPGQKDVLHYLTKAELETLYDRAGFQDIDVFRNSSELVREDKEDEKAEEGVYVFLETSSGGHFLLHLEFPPDVLLKAQTDIKNKFGGYRKGTSIVMKRVRLNGYGIKPFAAQEI